MSFYILITPIHNVIKITVISVNGPLDALGNCNMNQNIVKWLRIKLGLPKIKNNSYYRRMLQENFANRSNCNVIPIFCGNYPYGGLVRDQYGVKNLPWVDQIETKPLYRLLMPNHFLNCMIGKITIYPCLVNVMSCVSHIDVWRVYSLKIYRMRCWHQFNRMPWVSHSLSGRLPQRAVC